MTARFVPTWGRPGICQMMDYLPLKQPTVFLQRERKPLQELG